MNYPDPLNIYSPVDQPDDLLSSGPRVFISHRSLDKPLAAAVAAALDQIGIHYWFDREDEDTRRAAALGMAGDQALVHAIERGVQHSTHLLGLLSAETRGSWWVPYEIGFSRSAGRSVQFLVLESIRDMAGLPEYVRLVANYWSIDELIRWAASLSAGHLQVAAPSVRAETIDELTSFVPELPPLSTTRLLSTQALNAIETLGKPTTWTATALTVADRFCWMPTAGGILRDLAYDLFAPLAFYQLHASRLSQQERGRYDLLYRSATWHYQLAAAPPRLPYYPEDNGWRRRRYQSPASCWLQGLNLHQLQDRLNRFFAVDDLHDRRRLATREEFKAEFDRILHTGEGSDQQSLGVLVNPLFGFSPSSRPVYWRVLALQHQLHTAVVNMAASSMFEDSINELSGHFLSTMLASPDRDLRQS